MAGKTLYDKLWDDHLVKQRDDGSALIYIDRHLLHEVTSPQAFEGLRLAKRKPWRIDANLATPDHNVPTLIGKKALKVLLTRFPASRWKHSTRTAMSSAFLNSRSRICVRALCMSSGLSRAQLCRA